MDPATTPVDENPVIANPPLTAAPVAAPPTIAEVPTLTPSSKILLFYSSALVSYLLYIKKYFNKFINKLKNV